MASNHKIFLSSILTVIVLHQLIPTVRSDAALIQTVCNRSPEAGYCRLCLNDFIGSRNQDVAGLARLTITCTENQALTVGGILDHYNHSTQIKEIGQCVVIYKGIKNTVASAMQSWQKKRYEDAALLLDAAKEVHWQCFNLLVKAKRFIPSDLATEFNKFRAFDDVARNVVRQIGK